MIDLLSIVLLMSTVSLSVIRNILSKGVSVFSYRTKEFYFVQFIIFLSGTVLLAMFTPKAVHTVSTVTIIYGILYGLLLIAAQWGYTIALSSGKISVCTVVYSLGFIFPTVSGALVWNEEFNLFKALGCIMVILAIIISGKHNTSDKTAAGKSTYILPLVLAMLSSGGLGFMQKVQQNSQYPKQKAIFVITGFITAATISLVCSIFVKQKRTEINKNYLLKALGAGSAFGCSNLLNTTLSGRLASAVFFPLQNISVLLFSLIAGIFIFNEKITQKEFLIFILGVIAILLLNM